MRGSLFALFGLTQVGKQMGVEAQELPRSENMHSPFMQKAIELAVENVKTGKGGPFGAVVVRNGRIVATGTNTVTALNDPTAHAEIVAIRQSCSRLDSFHLDDCELYTSCEPCPMCLGAIYWARCARVYYGATRADAARAGFDDSLIYEQLDLPIKQRSLKMTQIMPVQAVAPFDAWARKPDKTPY